MWHFICASVVVLVLCPQGTEDRLAQLGSKDAIVRLEAVRALEESGSQSAPVLERLVELLGDADGDVAYRARKALIAIGEPVHARLVGALANDLLRVSAAIALRYQDEPGRMALERYLEGDGPPEARLEVLSVLGTPGFDRILDLVDEHPSHALRALRRLRTRGRFFRRPTDFADRIVARVADQELGFACDLVLTASADPLPTDTFDRVIKWLEERESALQETASWALGVTHLARFTALWQTKEALPGLKALLAADDSMVRRTAAWAIGGILTRVRNQRGDLIVLGQRMSHDAAIPVPGMGTDFHYAWRRLIMGGKPLPPLLSEVTTWKWFCTLSSDDMRQMLQPRPRQSHGMYTEVVPLLTALLEDPDASVVRAAAWSLGGAGPDGAPATAKLAELLASSDRRVRMAAAMALADIGPTARAAKDAAARSLWDGGGDAYPSSTVM